MRKFGGYVGHAYNQFNRKEKGAFSEVNGTQEIWRFN
jgi:hypothetical protein